MFRRVAGRLVLGEVFGDATLDEEAGGMLIVVHEGCSEVGETSSSTDACDDEDAMEIGRNFFCFLRGMFARGEESDSVSLSRSSHFLFLTDVLDACLSSRPWTAGTTLVKRLFVSMVAAALLILVKFEMAGCFLLDADLLTRYAGAIVATAALSRSDDDHEEGRGDGTWSSRKEHRMFSYKVRTKRSTGQVQVAGVQTRACRSL